jgi:hypothetical protein
MLFLSLLFSASNSDALSAMLNHDGWTDMGSSEESYGTVSARHKPLDGLDCLEAQATTSLDADIMKAVILDIEGNSDWSSADLTLSEVLGAKNGRIDYVQVLDVPSPMSDRMWVLRANVKTDAHGWHFIWQRIEGEEYERVAEVRAANPDAVEISSNVGAWSLLPGEDGETVARFRSCNDVGGNIPKWAGEKAARALLPNNIKDLFVEAEKRGG